jgi:hypothetical protein
LINRLRRASEQQSQIGASYTYTHTGILYWYIRIRSGTSLTRINSEPNRQSVRLSEKSQSEHCVSGHDTTSPSQQISIISSTEETLGVLYNFIHTTDNSQCEWIEQTNHTNQQVHQLTVVQWSDRAGLSISQRLIGSACKNSQTHETYWWVFGYIRIDTIVRIGYTPSSPTKVDFQPNWFRFSTRSTFLRSDEISGTDHINHKSSHTYIRDLLSDR